MKKIILLIAVLTFLLPKVSASEVTLSIEKIYDIYAYFYDSEMGKSRYVYAEKFYFDGTLAYCLELGKNIYGGKYNSNPSFADLNISEEKLNKLKLIIHYGYEYQNHNTDNYFLATQELIWNEMSDISLTWVKTMTPSKVIDVSAELNEIQNLINTHYTKPSFDGDEIEVTLGEPLVLEDTNGVLNKFTTTSEGVSIEGNKLIITKDFDSEEITFTKANYTQDSFLLYTSGESQKMMSNGVVEEVTSTLKVKLTGGSIELTKLDKDTSTNVPQGEGTLKGAIYELYNEEGVLKGTITTGTNDKLDNLPLGKYTLKESTSSKGYLLDSNTYNIEITKENLNIKIDVYEEAIKRKIEIFKVFASNTTGALSPESGITFEVYDKNNILIDTLITDSEGYATVTLPYGTYTFKQTTTTKNYYKVDDFKITISEYNEKPIYKLLSDSEITAKVKIIKKDLDTKENIVNSSIKFKIFDVTNNKYLSLKVSYPENKETTEFQIDKNGIFITPEALPPGDYIIEEIQESMNGYLYNSEKIPFTIGENTNFIEENGEAYLEITFYNKPAKGCLNIIKYGEEIIYKDNSYYYKEIQLKDVIFNLYAKEDVYENGILIYQKDDLVKELTTDEEGKITEGNLPLGKYYLKEIITSNNHVLDDTIYDVELTYKDELTPVVTQSIKIKNYLYKGALTINKYETGTTKSIPNTLIEVRTKDNKVIYKGYTDSNGQIFLEDIPYGEYYLSEVEASTGYRLLEDRITFEINDETQEITIYNERIKVPNTGYSLSTLDIFVIISTLLGVFLIVFFPKEKRTVFLSILIIILGITYFVIVIYKYQNDKVSNDKSVTAYINNQIETVTEEKYQYKSILEIPSINLKRGVLAIESEYNSAKYNIELIKEDDNTIVLAAHNGNNLNSFFGNLHNIELGDSINYYQDGVFYNYIYSESYDIKKNGYADIYRKDNERSIILITCKDNTDDAQTVYIGYLKETSTY